MRAAVRRGNQVAVGSGREPQGGWSNRLQAAFDRRGWRRRRQRRTIPPVRAPQVHAWCFGQGDESDSKSVAANELAARASASLGPLNRREAENSRLQAIDGWLRKKVLWTQANAPVRTAAEPPRLAADRMFMRSTTQSYKESQGKKRDVCAETPRHFCTIFG
jgi:hypothetical protein